MLHSLSHTIVGDGDDRTHKIEAHGSSFDITEKMLRGLNRKGSKETKHSAHMKVPRRGDVAILKFGINLFLICAAVWAIYSHSADVYGWGKGHVDEFMGWDAYNEISWVTDTASMITASGSMIWSGTGSMSSYYCIETEFHDDGSNTMFYIDC